MSTAGWDSLRYVQSWARSPGPNDPPPWFRLLVPTNPNAVPIGIPARWGRNRAALPIFGRVQFVPPPPEE